jgi:quercetin dioxygenase-like cupin family protein
LLLALLARGSDSTVTSDLHFGNLGLDQKSDFSCGGQNMLRRLTLGAGILLLGLLSVTSYAQQDQIKRTIMQKVEYPGSQYLTIMGTAELAPGGTLARHTHPGIETGYILEGEGVMSIEGQPNRQMKAGDSYQVGVGVPHGLVNSSKEKPLKAMATWVVEKDKPFSSPAPK